jgi:hypothetical protein
MPVSISDEDFQWLSIAAFKHAIGNPYTIIEGQIIDFLVLNINHLTQETRDVIIDEINAIEKPITETVEGIPLRLHPLANSDWPLLRDFFTTQTKILGK